ncbi:ABC transporter substrate-binding protein [Thalassotalea eurytherma]|uniref:Organic solvent ABC transporter substrate-binding protein n=1 Tax=Thalassotalea eurytherma TaxID=1144278 RepID=A0ABQ6H0H5_9GAMM|nr:ABC transporter substrate-binding protein [Thalassotalea eurytherma]GLX81698.1 organic solvent ABC transporter substrate-binding protein [Thalassotalea eurytherma]
MKKLSGLLIGALLSIQVFASEVSKENPYQMIEEVADITFKRVASSQSDIRANPNLLKDVVREELIPYVDYRYAALKVLGTNLKKIDKKDLNEFIPVFKEYLITSYGQVFTMYNNQEVKFEPAKSTANKKIVAVQTLVIEPGREPISIAFKVRKNRKTNEWRAFDMIAEGVSLLDSKQAELSSLVRQKGLPYVTKLLKEKSLQDISYSNSVELPN